MSADLLADLSARQLVQESTDVGALGARLASGPVTLYYGMDPTADSLHVGNLIGLLVLRRFADAGHRPLALAGGATGMIGDPSGRSEERNLLDEATLDANAAAITAQIARVLEVGTGDGTVELVDNRDWTLGLSVVDFLRDVGRHAPVNVMLARESVKARMEAEAGISFTEFAYMLLQANDFLWLAEHRGCELQVGGSDQWGNILAGVDLIRRVRRQAVHGFAWPLLTATDGTKLGKTTGARVWLDPARTSPFRFSQHWLQTADADVERCLLQFTLRPVEEISELVSASRAAPERRGAQRVLAADVTTLVHGPAAAAAAEEAAEVLFGRGVDGASAEAVATVAAEVPGATVSRVELDSGVDLADLLVRTGLCASKGEARRAVDQGGAYLNDRRAEPGTTVGPDDLLHGRWALIRRGRRSYATVALSA